MLTRCTPLTQDLTEQSPFLSTLETLQNRNVATIAAEIHEHNPNKKKTKRKDLPSSPDAIDSISGMLSTHKCTSTTSLNI